MHTPRTDALRTSDYILTRNDCFMGMEKYRDFARTLERELTAEKERSERLEKAINWVLEDIGYRPPEQLGDKDIVERWVYRLRTALGDSNG